VSEEQRVYIVLAVENSGDLLKLCADLYAEKIPFVRYLDVDRSFEAIAIHPITKHRAHSLALRLLQPWRCACNEKAPLNRLAVPVPNDAPVAQRRAPDSNQRAVCPIHGKPMTLRFYDRGPGDPPGNAYACDDCLSDRRDHPRTEGHFKQAEDAGHSAVRSIEWNR
jgi:hypothetical protein